MATHSQHPLSQSIVKFYDGDLLEINDLKEIPGRGLKGNFNGKIILLGNQKLLSDYDVYLDFQGDSMSFFLYQEGQDPVFFSF